VSETLTMSYESSSIEYIKAHFWELWQQEWESIYRCCLKWMGNNSTLAEDALSQGMLKAWEKVQASACGISNFKGWVRTLTRNICTDMLRSQGREANRTESIEALPCLVDEVLVSQDEEFDPAAKRRDRDKILGGAIDELPPRLCEPIRLHYYQEKSYLEIALELGISSGNVRKRMSQARAILKEKLSGFVGEEDGVPPEPRKRGKSKKRSLRAPAVGESLQGVLPVGSGEPVGAALYALQGEPASEEPSAEGELGIVAGGEPLLGGFSVVPASFEVLEEEPLGIVAGGQLWDEPGTPTPSPRAGRGSLRGFGSRGQSFYYPSTVQRLEDGALDIVAGGFSREAGSFAVPVVPACGEVAKGDLGIFAGGEPLLGGLRTGRIMKILCTVLATPLSHRKAGWRTGVPPVQRPEMGTGGRTGGMPVQRREMGTGGRTGEMPVQRRDMGTGGTPVLRPDVGASVWDGHLGQKEPDAGVREMGWLFGLCWRIWADSGGCWLSSI
jgi:RNA polymerase sigma factor (sigma-70 family)